MKTETTSTVEGLKVTPIDWDATRRILRPLFDCRTHWIIVCHAASLPFIQRIEEKYYQGRGGDFTVITSNWQLESWILVAAKKRWLEAYKLSSLYRQMTGLKLDNEARRDLFIVAPPLCLQQGIDLAAHLFDRPRELAIAA